MHCLDLSLCVPGGVYSFLIVVMSAEKILVVVVVEGDDDSAGRINLCLLNLLQIYQKCLHCPIPP